MEIAIVRIAAVIPRKVEAEVDQGVTTAVQTGVEAAGIAASHKGDLGAIAETNIEIDQGLHQYRDLQITRKYESK